jgi:hypothetical protein
VRSTLKGIPHRRESRALRHNSAEDWLWLDIDLTPLPVSKHAEGSTKGKISAKKSYGRAYSYLELTFNCC